HAHQIFEHFADIAIGETKVAMSSLALDSEQSRIDELGKMCADRLFGDARNLGELGRRQRLAADKRGKHVCAGVISDQRRDAHDIRAVFHGSMLAEPLMNRNRVISAASEIVKTAPWPSFASFGMKSIRFSATSSGSMLSSGAASSPAAAAISSGIFCRTRVRITSRGA